MRYLQPFIAVNTVISSVIRPYSPSGSQPVGSRPSSPAHSHSSRSSSPQLVTPLFLCGFDIAHEASEDQKNKLIEIAGKIGEDSIPDKIELCRIVKNFNERPDQRETIVSNGFSELEWRSEKRYGLILNESNKVYSKLINWCKPESVEDPDKDGAISRQIIANSDLVIQAQDKLDQSTYETLCILIARIRNAPDSSYLEKAVKELAKAVESH